LGHAGLAERPPSVHLPISGSAENGAEAAADKGSEAAADNGSEAATPAGPWFVGR
jgi:hypothetical protein